MRKGGGGREERRNQQGESLKVLDWFETVEDQLDHVTLRNASCQCLVVRRAFSAPSSFGYPRLLRAAVFRTSNFLHGYNVVSLFSSSSWQADSILEGSTISSAGRCHL